MELFYTIIFFAQAFVFSLSIKLFHDIYFRNNDKGNPKLRFLAYFLLMLQSFSAVYFESSIYLNSFIGIMFQIFSLMIIKTSFWQKFISHLFSLSFIMLSEFVFSHMCAVIMDTPNKIPSPRSFEGVFMMCGARIVGVILVYLYKNFTVKKIKHSPTEAKLNLTQRIFYILNTVFALATVYFMILIIYPIQKEDDVWIAIVLSLLIMFFLITNFMSYIHNLDLQEYQRKASLLQQKMEHYSHEHQMLGECLKEISVFKHDMKHQLLPILAKLPKENQNILNEINSVFDKVFFEEYRYFSSSSFLDLLLNHQLHKAKLEHIEFDIKIESNLEIFAEPDVFSVILGNLLDNARESQAKVTDKQIKLQLSRQNANIFLKVENPFEGDIILKNGLPSTTKSEIQQHGLGLATVKSLVEREGGIFQFSTQNQIFEVEILLLNCH